MTNIWGNYSMPNDFFPLSLGQIIPLQQDVLMLLADTKDDWLQAPWFPSFVTNIFLWTRGGVLGILLMEEIRLTSWGEGSWNPINLQCFFTSQVVVWKQYHHLFWKLLFPVISSHNKHLTVYTQHTDTKDPCNFGSPEKRTVPESRWPLLLMGRNSKQPPGMYKTL